MRTTNERFTNIWKGRCAVVISKVGSWDIWDNLSRGKARMSRRAWEKVEFRTDFHGEGDRKDDGERVFPESDTTIRNGIMNPVSRWTYSRPFALAITRILTPSPCTVGLFAPCRTVSLPRMGSVFHGWAVSSSGHALNSSDKKNQVLWLVARPARTSTLLETHRYERSLRIRLSVLFHGIYTYHGRSSSSSFVMWFMVLGHGVLCGTQSTDVASWQSEPTSRAWTLATTSYSTSKNFSFLFFSARSRCVASRKISLRRKRTEAMFAAKGWQREFRRWQLLIR